MEYQFLCHFLRKGLENDGSNNIDTRTGIVVDATHIRIQGHVTAGDFVVVGPVPFLFLSSISLSFRERSKASCPNPFDMYTRTHT